MALIFADRVKETTTTSGTGAVTLLGASTGYQSFTSGIGNANTCYYCIASQTLGTWEVGLGTYSTTGPTLTRTTPLAGSSATPVTFGSETKDVFVTSPALWATSPAFTGAMSASSGAFGGATIGSSALAVTGASALGGQLLVNSTTTTNAYIYSVPTTSLQYQFWMQGTNTFAGTATGMYINPNINGTAASGALVGLQVTPIFSPLVAVGNIYATSSVAYLNSSFAPTNVMAVRGVIQLSANSLTGTISNAYSFYANAPNIDASATTTITSAIQFRAENITKGTAQTITNAYGFYGNQGTGSATNSWNLYMAGAAPNWLNGSLYLGSTTAASAIVTGKAAATFQYGDADAASPVAQTVGVQSVVAGTTNTAGANFTIAGSQGTGTGAGGLILIRCATTGTTGSTQNPLATVVTFSGASSTSSTFVNSAFFQGASGVNQTSAGAFGAFSVHSGGNFNFSSASSTTGTGDTILTRKAAATLQHGAADAAAPVAQTVGVQSVVAGTTDTAGANFTINGSRGTGTGAGGSIIFQTAPASTTGSTQNALATALTIASTGTVTAGALVATTLNGNTFTTGTYTLTGTAAKTLNFTNTLTLSGTDSTVMTFPTTSATIARTDAAQTFTGIQTFAAPVLGTPTSGTLSACTVDGTAGNNVGFINLPQLSKTAAYILAAADRGKHVSITTGGVTVNVSTFAAGDAVTIFNNSASAQTITQGTSATMYLAGTATTGNRTLAQRGVCTILCITGGASAVYVISGAGLT